MTEAHYETITHISPPLRTWGTECGFHKAQSCLQNQWGWCYTDAFLTYPDNNHQSVQLSTQSPMKLIPKQSLYHQFITETWKSKFKKVQSFYSNISYLLIP